MSLKVIFFTSEWLETCSDAFPSHQNQVLYKQWLKTCFDAFAHTSRPPETLKKKDIYDSLKWLKTCFDAFSHTSRPPETFVQKRYFLPSGVVKNVF